MINFLKYTFVYVLISLTVIGSGIYSLHKWGVNYSIEFTGGTELSYEVNNPSNLNLAVIKRVFAKHKIRVKIEFKGKELHVITKSLGEKEIMGISDEIATLNKNAGIKLVKWDVVGPVLGKETMEKTIAASFLAIILILTYMTFAFKNFFFALAAILAMIHDFLVTIGVYSLLCHFFGAQVDTLFVTAILTNMSFSVHDTIIIFDKIREYRGMGKDVIDLYANKALTETLIRSINNSMTIIFMLLSLILLGGSTIRFFVAALLIGAITGTYSSPFVATPILVFLIKRFSKK